MQTEFTRELDRFWFRAAQRRMEAQRLVSSQLSINDEDSRVGYPESNVIPFPRNSFRG